MDYSPSLTSDLVIQVGAALLQKKWLLATAESCTGGLVSATMTDIAGSSVWFDCGFVTYSNQSKMQLLDVSETTLNLFGAVSEETALEMAIGALKNSRAQIALSITGIAGPSGGSAEKPIGMVCFAWAILHKNALASTQHFQGNRQAVREQAVQYTINSLLKILNAS